jgi:Flp pilus assembly protein TadG
MLRPARLCRTAWGQVRAFMHREDGGAAIIEFAFGTVVFFGILAAIIDFSAAMYSANNVEHAAKEGVRYASIHGALSADPKSDAEIEAYVKGRVLSLDSTKMSVSVTWTPDANPGSDVTIAVDYVYEAFFQNIIPSGPFTLKAKSTFMVGR